MSGTKNEKKSDNFFALVLANVTKVVTDFP